MNFHVPYERVFCGSISKNSTPALTTKFGIVKKLSIFLLSIVFLQVNAKSQGINITLSEKNASLKKVLSEIRKQSGCSMLYNSDLIVTANLVSIDVKDVSL